VTADLAERVRRLDAACRAIWRDPADIAGPRGTDAGVETAYRDFVRTHRAIGPRTSRPAAGDGAPVGPAQDRDEDIGARSELA
jgi:hypothetical protein